MGLLGHLVARVKRLFGRGWGPCVTPSRRGTYDGASGRYVAVGLRLEGLDSCRGPPEAECRGGGGRFERSSFERSAVARIPGWRRLAGDVGVTAPGEGPRRRRAASRTWRIGWRRSRGASGPRDAPTLNGQRLAVSRSRRSRGERSRFGRAGERSRQGRGATREWGGRPSLEAGGRPAA